MGFYQVATRVPEVFAVTFPKEAQGLLSIFEVFNVNIAKLSLPLSCIGLGTFRQQMLFTMLFPLVIAACIFLGCFVYVMCARTTKDTGMGSMKNIVAEAKKSAIQIAKDDRKSPLKVAGLLATSPGRLGGIRGLSHLRDILLDVGIHLSPSQYALPGAHECFRSDGSLSDGHMDESVLEVGRQVVRVARALKTAT